MSKLTSGARLGTGWRGQSEIEDAKHAKAVQRQAAAEGLREPRPQRWRFGLGLGQARWVVSGALLSPLLGFLFGLLSFGITLWLKSAFDWRAARKRLLQAFVTDINLSFDNIAQAVVDEASQMEGDAEALLDAIRRERVTFEDVNRLPSGWVIYAPDFRLADVATKLKRNEVELAIRYIDAWARLVEAELRYRAALDCLLELVPVEAKTKIRATEQAERVKDALIAIAGIAGEVRDNGLALREAAQGRRKRTAAKRKRQERERKELPAKQRVTADTPKRIQANTRGPTVGGGDETANQTGENPTDEQRNRSS